MTTDGADGQEIVTLPRSALHVQPFYHVSFRTKVTNTHIRLVNGSTSTQVYKIKTTSNDLFDVDPVMGDLGPFESVSVSIRFKGTPPTEEEELAEGAHMVYIYNLEVESTDPDVEKEWDSVKSKGKENPFDGVHKLTCIFEDDCVSGASEPDVWSEATDAEIDDKDKEGYDWDQDQWTIEAEVDMNYESEQEECVDHWAHEAPQEHVPIPFPEDANPESYFASVMTTVSIAKKNA